MRNLMNHLSMEIGMRFGLAVLFFCTELLSPRIRNIQPEEWWLYKNPPVQSYFPTEYLWVMGILYALLFWSISYIQHRHSITFLAPCLLGFSLSILLNGIVTNFIKLFVGRPRPDFYYRCFPNGIHNAVYTGNDKDILEGRKSFPSGHSSFAFACAAFTSLFLCGQFRLFSRFNGFDSNFGMDNYNTEEGESGINANNNSAFGSNGSSSMNNNVVIAMDSHDSVRCPVRLDNATTHIPPVFGVSWQLCTALIPMMISGAIALSRMMDFHHHPEDVMAGCLLGCAMGYLCYRCYFPSVYVIHSHLTLYEITKCGFLFSAKSNLITKQPKFLH